MDGKKYDTLIKHSDHYTNGKSFHIISNKSGILFEVYYDLLNYYVNRDGSCVATLDSFESVIGYISDYTPPKYLPFGEVKFILSPTGFYTSKNGTFKIYEEILNERIVYHVTERLTAKQYFDRVFLSYIDLIKYIQACLKEKDYLGKEETI